MGSYPEAASYLSASRSASNSALRAQFEGNEPTEAPTSFGLELGEMPGGDVSGLVG